MIRWFVRFFYSSFTDICVGFVWAKIYEHCISLKERINSMYVCMYILYYMMYHWKGSTLTDSNVLCFWIFSCDFLPHWNGNATQQPYDVMALAIWYHLMSVKHNKMKLNVNCIWGQQVVLYSHSYFILL